MLPLSHTGSRPSEPQDQHVLDNLAAAQYGFLRVDATGGPVTLERDDSPTGRWGGLVALTDCTFGAGCEKESDWGSVPADGDPVGAEGGRVFRLTRLVIADGVAYVYPG